MRLKMKISVFVGTILTDIKFRFRVFEQQTSAGESQKLIEAGKT